MGASEIRDLDKKARTSADEAYRALAEGARGVRIALRQAPRRGNASYEGNGPRGVAAGVVEMWNTPRSHVRDMQEYLETARDDFERRGLQVDDIEIAIKAVALAEERLDEVATGLKCMAVDRDEPPSGKKIGRDLLALRSRGKQARVLVYAASRTVMVAANTIARDARLQGKALLRHVAHG